MNHRPGATSLEATRAVNISIVVPVLDEVRGLPDFIDHLQALPAPGGLGPADELILVDGGSTDGTRQWLDTLVGATVLDSDRPGRGRQMNLGAASARGDVLLFLHADLKLPPDGLAQIREALRRAPEVVGGGFLKTYDRPSLGLALMQLGLNVFRTQMCKNLVGTNGIFVRTRTFRELGGFHEAPLLEDVELCDRLKHAGPLAILRGPLAVSSRKYRDEGFWRRTWINARVMFGYRVLGREPSDLERLYR